MVRALLLLLGASLVANGIWLAFTANLNLGTFATIGLGAVIAAWAIRPPRSSWLNVLLASSTVIIGTLAGILLWSGSADNAEGAEDAVIVLGAAVHGTEPSITLADRLNTALTYHARNPAALIVVSGGQGPQEDLPESTAMSNYLIGHGVPAEQVIAEPSATSTEENFAYSKKLLDQRLPAGYRVVFVTNEFHVWRAGLIAQRTGLDATHVASRTPWYFWPTSLLREEFAAVSTLIG